MRLFFSCELYNDEGYNLNAGIEHQYNINRDNFNRGDHWLIVRRLAEAIERKRVDSEYCFESDQAKRLRAANIWLSIFTLLMSMMSL